MRSRPVRAKENYPAAGCKRLDASPTVVATRNASLRGWRGSLVIPREHFAVLLIIPVIRELSSIPGPSSRIPISVEIRAGRVSLVSN